MNKVLLLAVLEVLVSVVLMPLIGRLIYQALNTTVIPLKSTTRYLATLLIIKNCPRHCKPVWSNVQAKWTWTMAVLAKLSCN